MNDEEIKAIRSIEQLIKWLEKWNDKYEIVPEDKKYFEIILSLIEKQKAENIDEITEKISREKGVEDFEFCDNKCADIDEYIECKQCIKEYFENKVKESK